MFAIGAAFFLMSLAYFLYTRYKFSPHGRLDRHHLWHQVTPSNPFIS